MEVALFWGYMIFGLLFQAFLAAKNNAEPGSIEMKYATKVLNVLTWMLFIPGLIFVLYILGWIWYFFCSGFLVFEDQPFIDRVMCGLISLLPLGVFIGFIMICCGINPMGRR